MQNAAIEGMPKAGTDLKILTQLNLDYVRSVEERDVSWFDRHISPDFMNSNPDGTIVDRKGFLAQVSRGAGVSDLEAHDVIVRVIGDLAIIHARTTFETPSGKPGSGRYTDIWSYRSKRWLCVAAHVTRC
jgi:ketosteroid isomerase-like protein